MSWRLGLAAMALGLAAGCASAGDGTAVAEAEADPGPVSCRDILVPGSNVLQQACMTEADWEEYERMRRRQSQEMTRRLQGLGGGF